MKGEKWERMVPVSRRECWTYNATSRVLVGDFSSFKTIPLNHKQDILRLMEMDDVALVLKGLCELQLSASDMLELIDANSLGAKLPKIMRFDREPCDGGDGVVYREHETFSAMNPRDYINYLETMRSGKRGPLGVEKDTKAKKKRKRSKKGGKGSHRKKPNRGKVFEETPDMSEIEEIQDYRLYLYDYDVSDVVGFMKLFRGGHKMPEMLPGGDYCAMKDVSTRTTLPVEGLCAQGW